MGSPFASKHGLVVFRAMATNLKDYESHYDIMGVTPESTKTEIREAWLRLSMLYHPDLNKENEEATNKFMEIKESYKILINDEKRKAYNDKIGFTILILHQNSTENGHYRERWIG